MKSKLITTIGTLTLLAATALSQATTAPKTKMPDLIITGAQRLTSSPNRLLVTVKNQGVAPAGANKLEFLTRTGPNLIKNNFLVAALAPGSSVQIPVDNNMDLGKAEVIELRADIGGDVTEGNEGNNLLKVK